MHVLDTIPVVGIEFKCYEFVHSKEHEYPSLLTILLTFINSDVNKYSFSFVTDCAAIEKVIFFRFFAI